MIQIDEKRCIGCGQCVGDCFPGALTMEAGRPRLSAPGSCLGCGHCISVCPVGAVADDALDMAEAMPLRKEVAPEKLLDLMRARRSCRHYRREPVPKEVLLQIVEAARHCPTAMNLQKTRYLIVQEQIPALLDAALETLGGIGEAQRISATDPNEIRRANNFIAWRDSRREDRAFDPLFFHAPALIIFVSPRETMLDAASAAAYGEITAAALGLGALYSGYFAASAANSPEIRRLLSLEENEMVARCLVLGYPDISFRRTAPRKKPDVRYL